MVPALGSLAALGAQVVVERVDHLLPPVENLESAFGPRILVFHPGPWEISFCRGRQIKATMKRADRRPHRLGAGVNRDSRRCNNK